MARKGKSSSRRNKIEPSAMTIGLVITAPPGVTSSHYCDVSQIACLVNRRFYRQGLNWGVAGFKAFNVDGIAGGISISKLPNTWVMANAWEKSMRAWMKMNRDALEESESIRPRFLDFKIYADSLHHQQGYGANLLPYGAIAPATAGEWESSKVSIPLTTPAGVIDVGQTIEREFVATGASYPGVSVATGFDAVSLIEGYASSRGLPDVLDPNVPGDALDAGGSTPENWMGAMFNEGTNQTHDVLEDLTTENNQAPYPFEGGNDPNEFLPSGLPNPGWNLPFPDTMYPGGANQLTGLQYHDAEYFTPTTISNIVRLKGGNFPCGLIRFDTTNSGLESATFSVVIDLIPGRHRGYLAESMVEM
ncbi:MAG: hypothetical protein [Circular genetic element sp.]|nr:MAG: hypothetical protein [Circular genetic element sp.]